MSFLLWQRDGNAGIASPRVVLRAEEVPLLAHAQQLCDALEGLHNEQSQRVAQASSDAREQGHAQGREEGRREACEQSAQTLASLATVSALERERLRGEIGALALQVVRKLLGHFADDEVLAALAGTAANDMLPTRPLALVVHPDLCHAVRERLSANVVATPGHTLDHRPSLRCEVRGDASCARDTCRIETEHGSVDASLEAQLARLAGVWGLT